MTVKWRVKLSREAKKAYRKVEKSGRKKPSMTDVIDALSIDLEKNGPWLFTWPNYSEIDKGSKNSYYHCHLKKGNPTYVAC